MTITAKFASRCPQCSQQISPGQQVEWERGQPARHTDCSSAAAPATAPQPKPITLERTGRRTWFRGDTYGARNILRDGGAKWDQEAKAWWIGDHAKAETLADQARKAPTAVKPKETVSAPSNARRTCRGCRGPIRHAAHHAAMGGYCGKCAFDEFDC